MDKKQMYVQVVNLSTGKMFSLPTLYTDRTEACVCGQNYIRDRQTEDHNELIFFRILDVCPDGTVAPSYELWDDEDEDDPVCGDCDHDCQFCPTNYKVEEEDEEPEHGESVFGGVLVTELINLLKNKVPEAPEEPNYLFEHWND